MSGALTMVIGLLMVAGVAGAVGLVLFNGLVRLRNEIDRAFANIDVLLRQRADEIPNLVRVCEGYAAHEKAALQAVVSARELMNRAVDAIARDAADQGLSAALGALFARTEQYPALKADALFQQLASRVTALENEIADRRELLNATVVRYNTRLELVPDRFIARWGGLSPRRGLTVVRPEARTRRA